MNVYYIEYVDHGELDADTVVARSLEEAIANMEKFYGPTFRIRKIIDKSGNVMHIPGDI